MCNIISVQINIKYSDEKLPGNNQYLKINNFNIDFQFEFITLNFTDANIWETIQFQKIKVQFF